MYHYSIVDDTIEKEQLIHDLFARNGNAKSREHLHWQYTANAVHGSHLVIATEETTGEVGGMYAVFCVEMDVFDKTLPCVQSLDTLTDEKHRGKGLFTKLAKRMYEELEHRQLGLVYGFPNVNSAHGFFNKLQWKNLNPTPFLIRILSYKFLMRKMRFPLALAKPNVQMFQYNSESDKSLRLIHQFDTQVDSLWQRFNNGKFVAVKRNAAYLNWRYCEKPGFAYRKVGCFDEQGKLLGFIVGSLQAKHGTSLLYIMEMIVDSTHGSEVGEKLLNAMLRVGKQCGAEVSLAWAIESAPTYTVFRNNWYFPLPERFRPIELNFGYRNLSDKTLAERRDFYISYSDSDTV